MTILTVRKWTPSRRHFCSCDRPPPPPPLQQEEMHIIVLFFCGVVANAYRLLYMLVRVHRDCVHSGSHLRGPFPAQLFLLPRLGIYIALSSHPPHLVEYSPENEYSTGKRKCLFFCYIWIYPWSSLHESYTNVLLNCYKDRVFLQKRSNMKSMCVFFYSNLTAKSIPTVTLVLGNAFANCRFFCLLLVILKDYQSTCHDSRHSAITSVDHSLTVRESRLESGPVSHLFQIAYILPSSCTRLKTCSYFGQSRTEGGLHIRPPHSPIALDFAPVSIYRTRVSVSCHWIGSLPLQTVTGACIHVHYFSFVYHYGRACFVEFLNVLN